MEPNDAKRDTRSGERRGGCGTTAGHVSGPDRSFGWPIRHRPKTEVVPAHSGDELDAISTWARSRPLADSCARLTAAVCPLLPPKGNSPVRLNTPHRPA